MTESLMLAIIGQILQVTIVASIGLLLCRFVFRRSPKFAYWMSLGLLCSFLIPPVIFSPLPSVGSLIENQIEQFRPQGCLPDRSAIRLEPSCLIDLNESAGRWVSPVWHIDPPSFSGMPPSFSKVIDKEVDGSLVFLPYMQTRFEPWSPIWIALGWTSLIFYCGGLSFFIFRDIRRILKTRALISNRSVPETDSVSLLFSRLNNQICPRRQVCLLVTNQNHGPASFGMLHPIVVMPRDLLCHPDVELMLAHELTHLRRFDYAFSALQMVCRWVWWFHPLVHLLSGQTNHAREALVDAEAISRTGSGTRRYANCLLEIANNNRMKLAFNHMSAASKRQLEIRLQLILRKNRKSPFNFLYGLLFVLFMLATVPDRSHEPGRPDDGLVISGAWLSDIEFPVSYQWSKEK